MPRVILSILLLLTILFLPACGKSIFKDEQNQLPSVVKDYYKYMRWRYYEKAINFVHHEQVAVFDEITTDIKDSLNITNYEIKEAVDIDESDPEQPTRVRVLVVYYRYPSVSEKTAEVNDVWIKKGKSWFVKPDFSSDIFKR